MSRLQRVRLLDLFCGAGGAGEGYSRAGFDVVGVDVKPQPNYPLEFIQGDALEYLAAHGHEFDAIHASPPCQAYSISRNNGCHPDAPDLLPATLEALRALAARHWVAWVVENVVGAPMPNALILCGASFGLGASGFDLNRHRCFLSNVAMLFPQCQHRRGKTIGVYGHGTNSWHRERFGRNVRISEMREAMGIDWMTRAELSQAIPPAYTEFIGTHIRAAVLERWTGRKLFGFPVGGAA